MSERATRSCPVCGEQGELTLGPSRELTLDTVAVAAAPVPVVACAQRHDATPPDVVDAAMQATAASIPRAKSRLLRDDACGSCGTRLTMPVRRTTRAVTVEPPDGPVFTLQFDLPSTRCTDCGTDQVPSRSQEDLVVVVPALFARS